MAKLVIKSEGFQNQILELRLGVNRLGRAPGNDFQIEHPTISATHCELELRDSGVIVRDCESTNGTFVAERPVDREANLWAGQILRVGDVEILVESTDVNISIPKITVVRPAPPVVLDDGGMLCARHKARVTYQCTHCHQILCNECIHRLRRKGGRTLILCPDCSNPAKPINAGERKKKKSLLGFLARTVKMPFVRKPDSE